MSKTETTETRITPREFARRMRAIIEEESGDAEQSHLRADRLMLETLRSLGYKAGCDVFEDMERWYA